MTTANVNVTKVLLKRGNTVQNNNYTGVSGELTIDTQLKTLRVHDGVTAGGNAITALGAIGSYSNTNTAAYLASQSITSANIGAFQTFANANAATQATSINSINANVGAYQTFANANAATQATGISTLDANLGTSTTNITTLFSNAATQAISISTVNANVTAANSAIQSLSANIGTLVAGAPGALDTLLELGNALGNSSSFSSTMVTWLGNITSNVTAANVRITTLDANLGTATTNITTLFSNAATQSSTITTLQTQVYANANVASYLPTYSGNIAANIVKNGYTWTFGTDAVLTLPSGATILESGYGSAGAIRLKPNGGTSTQYLEIAPTTVDGNHVHLMAGSGTELFLGDDNHYVKLANTGGVVINSNDSAGNTAQWTFGKTGTTQFPGSKILAPVSESITMQSDQYSQLMWENANLTVAPDMAINSNFYVAQNNATLDIGYRDGSGTQVIKSWYWNADGIMTLPTAGRINFDNLSISSDANVSAFYAPAGNVQLAAGIGDAQIVANSLNDSKTWTFGNTGNLTIPGSINFANGVNILSTVAGTYGNTQVAAYLPTYTGNITAGNLTITGNLNQPNRGFGNGPGTNLYITAGHTQGCSIPGGNTIISGGLGYNGIAHNGGNVTLRTGDYYSKQWNFDYAGNLTLPAGGVIAEGGGLTGAIRLTPAGGANANQALLIYPTGVAEGDHIHLTAGGGSTELYLGNDFHYVKLVDGGNIELRAATANLSAQAAWTFDTTGNIDTIQALGIKVPDGVPTNVAIINSTTGSWEANPMSNLATTGGTGSGLTVNVAETGGYASTIEIATAGTGYTNGDLITVTSGTSNATFTIVIGGRNSWRFGIDGNLTLPQTGYLKVGSGIVPAFISSPAPIITGFSNISAQNFTFLANGVNILSAVGAYQTFANANAATQATSINTINNTLTSSNVAIGLNTGSNAQSSSATAVGAFAGYDTQGIQTVAIGSGAGYTNQKQYAVAVGYSAGSDFQGAQAVAIGADAGYATQGAQAVAIGLQAGQVSQGTKTVAIGSGAGQNTQGVAAVAIGFGAGQTNQGNNSIILNATGSVLNRTTASTFTVAPVRNDSGNVAQALYYNTTTKEVTYANATAGGNYSNTNVAAYLSTATITTTGNVTAANFVGNISITGNVTGTSSNVTLQAGAYTSVFDNQGNVTVPQLFTAGNIQTAGYLVGNALGTTAAYTGNVTVGGNLTIIGTKSNVPVKTGGFVAQNTAVSIDSITAQWLNTGGLSANQLQLAALNGNVSILYTYTFQDGTGGSTTGGSSSTTLANLSFGWTSIGNPSGVAGDMYNVLVSLPGTNAYRITAMTGSSYSDNVLTVERLV
jgi:hypothetical protein